MTAKLDPALCRRLAFVASECMADGHRLMITELRDAAAQLTAAADLAERMSGTRIEELEDAMCTAIDAMMVGVPAPEIIERLQAVLDDPAPRRTITEDEVREVVREAFGDDPLCVIHGPKARTATAPTRPNVPPAPPAIDRNAIWRAAVDAASQVLHADPNTATLHVVDRQQVALAIGRAVLERLAAAAVRRWTGTIGDPCWTCQRPRSEHSGAELACPEPAAPETPAVIDTMLAAFRTLGPGYRVSFADHEGWLHVSVQSPDAAGADGVARACAAFGAPPAEQAECDSHTWLRSKIERGPNLTITITGNWQPRPRIAAGTSDIASTAA